MPKDKIVGTILILVNVYYVYHYARLWYLYEYTDILFMMLPTWEIIMNLIIGLIGIHLGFKVFNKSLSILKGILMSIGLMTICQIINLITNL